ncbi:alkaline phosphatase D family protein [Urbifossiella limnaea]|uniref:Alkaline phosphatase D n=1 Tax=Urbifossiella limnaea TaxID=2528023 RepID=A0A517XZ72_9BACT|nr:alkaline phosphatase D family protein [Urbifossiella limnaea]QDU22783.1 Alkaline phosphatase D precursor [Urbifossiella limnaea]
MRRLLLPFAVLVAAVSLAPAQPPAAPLTRIAFGSCGDQDQPLPILDSIVAAKPELFLFLGDNIYADIDEKTNKLIPAAKITAERIAAKYDILRGLPGFQKLKATCPFMATWDDHDLGANDAGGDFALKDASQKLFLDFFGAAANDPRRTQKGVYTAAVFGPPGKRVQVIMLDTRYHRTKLTRAKSPLPGEKVPPYAPNADPGATVLGEAQWAWLEAQLKQPAEVRLIGSSIQLVADEHRFEKWSNFPKERERFYELVRKTNATGVVVLSGDRHLGEISLDSSTAGYPLYDVTSSGLNQGAKAWREPEPNKHRVAAMPYGDNFGMVLIDWSTDNPRLTLQLRDEDGDVMSAVKVRLSTLKPTGVAAGPRPKLPDGVLTPAEAAAKVGQKVTVQFPVASTGGQTNLYLNSARDFRAKDNFAVALTAAAKAGPWADATGATFLNKTIRASGTVQVVSGSARIEVTAPAQLVLVE